MNIKKLVVLILVSFGLFQVNLTIAQNSEPRQFDSEMLESLQDDGDFDYYPKAVAERSYFESLKYWLERLFEPIADFLENYFNFDISPQVFNMIFYGIIIASIVFLVMKLTGADFRKLVYFRKEPVKKVDFKIEDEDIENIDFEEKIKEAKALKDHALVIRYYYLYAVQLLSENGKVDYHVKKTNSEYLRELSNANMRQTFESLASTFEFIWYGKFTAFPDHGEQMEKDFVKLKSVLD